MENHQRFNRLPSVGDRSPFEHLSSSSIRRDSLPLRIGRPRDPDGPHRSIIEIEYYQSNRTVKNGARRRGWCVTSHRPITAPTTLA